MLQFNAILQTRDTARGLIVNMSDVLFDTAKFSLRPAAREKLARVAGILSGHPSLHMQIEGYTDSVGTDEYNQLLSEHRAGSVRDYLTGTGIPSDSVSARGFGKTQPVATNKTAIGRQQNRRVELVISGKSLVRTYGLRHSWRRFGNPAFSQGRSERAGPELFALRFDHPLQTPWTPRPPWFAILPR